ncbi:hypothetical protein Aperf_G00000083487 [Anoplocephala perfoliata]
MTTKAMIFTIFMVIAVVIADDDDDFSESLLRTRRQSSSKFTIGAVLDSMDLGTEQAMLSGLRTVARNNINITKVAIIRLPKDNFFNATNSVCELLKMGVVGLVSPPDPLIRQSVRMVAKQFQIPLIETHWDTDRSNSRFAINVHPAHDAFGQAVFEYLSTYSKWNHAVLILADYGNIVKHTAWLNNFEGTLVIRTLGPDRAKWKPIIAELATTDNRNFLLDIPYWYAKDFLVLAYVHNMTGEQYNYVFTDWDTHLLDLSSFKIADGASISTFSIMPNIDPHESYGRGPYVENLRSTINKIERARRYSDILPFLTASAALIYDAMLMFEVALFTLKDSVSAHPGALTCDSSTTAFWPHGEKLVKFVKSSNASNLPTITGNILFDRQGYRSNFNMSILSLQDNGMQEIGYWNHRDRLQITRPIKKKKKVPKKPLTAVTLRVTTVPDTPFVIPKKHDAYGNPLKTPDAWEGYCVDLLNLIAADVGFNYTIDITMDHYGSRQTNESGEVYYNGIVGVVNRGEADMAVAALTITYEREQVLDFSTPFMTLGGSLLFMRPKSQKPSIFSFLQPLSPTVWAYVITIYIVVSVGLFLVARLSPYEWQNPHPCEAFSEEKENQFTVLSSFWFFITPLLNQGTEMAPHSISTRLLTGIWWFFALIIISTYTANLAAFLTVDTTELPIESVEDLVAQTKIKYGTLQSGSSHDFFKYSRIPVFQQMWEFMSKNDVFVQNTEEGIERVLKGDYVFVLESTWNEFYNKRDCRLMQIGRLLDSKGYGIGLQQGSPYRDPISESILKLQKAQTLDQLKRKWWTEFNISEPCVDAKDASKEAKPLGIEQVGGVFVLLVIGFLWAFIVSVIEFCVHNKACVKSHSALFSAMWKELKFAMRCMTPSTRAKSSTPVIHENTPAPDSTQVGTSSEAVEHLADHEHMEPLSVQSQNLLIVPVADSNEALLSSSAGDTSSSGGISVEESYPPPPPPQANSSAASPWSHLGNNQRKSPSVGEDWWRINQSATAPKLDNPICPKHPPKDPRASFQMANQQCMPTVCIALTELHPNVLRLLQEHNNLISAMGFTHCYEEIFGPLKKFESGKPLGEGEGESKENYVPLEHLITCIPGVTIESTLNGVRVIKLLSEKSQDEAAAPPSASEVVSQSLTTSVTLRHFRREIVDLLKQQPDGTLLFSKFIPVYHSHFGKQCRVSDYGYTRLQDLIEALRGIVHIVGEGPHRAIMLTHAIQVRRFTHDLLRMLKSEQKKLLRVDEIPKIYKAAFNKPFQPSNYGVCTMYDLLNGIPENKLVMQNVKDEVDPNTEYPAVLVPLRVQTLEQRAQTNLFATEVVDLLATAQRFQIAFTKFIPAYHHAFNHQCRVAEYGFVKFIELLEAIPHVVEVFEENGERRITLTPSLRMALIRQMVLEILELQTRHQMLLDDLVSAFLTHYQLILLPQDYGFETLEEMLSSFPDIVILKKPDQQESAPKATPSESTAGSVSLPVLESEELDDVGDTNKSRTYVLLLDRFEVRQSAFQCLQILLNSPFGSIPENEFKENFRNLFNEEIDLNFVNREMSPFISVKDYSVQCQDQNVSRNDNEAQDAETKTQSLKVVQLCPLILFARQLRFLLMRTRGRLMMNLVEQMYLRHFGVALSPEAYGYPSLVTLINAVNFVVVVRGRGSRATLFLAQDYLGKLARSIAYKVPFRHNLIKQSQVETFESKYLPQSMIIEKDYLLPPDQQSIANKINWTYPDYITPNLVGSPGFPPLGIQPQIQPADLSNYFLHQGYVLSDSAGFAIPGQNQDLTPITNDQTICYPDIVSNNDMAKMTPDYVLFGSATGTCGQTLTSMWCQSPVQQTAPVSIFANQMKTPGQQSIMLGYYVNPLMPVAETPVDIGLLNQFTPRDNENIKIAEIKQEPEQASLSEEAFKSGSICPTVSPQIISNWISKGEQTLWPPSLIHPNSQNPTFTDGQVKFPQEGMLVTDFNQWSNLYCVPMLQATPMSIQSPLQSMDPQNVMLNSGIYVGNPFTQIPGMISEVDNVAPMPNKCEEGEWTLPISMTTESTVDANTKENDKTESIE